MSSTEEATVYQGRVKWFNNKAGYGFITVIDSNDNTIPDDVFAHHSAICVNEEQYKYLVQGEYVEFVLSTVESGKDYKYQSTNIRGVNGGNLLCETRNSVRQSRPRPNRRNQGVTTSGDNTNDIPLSNPALTRSLTTQSDHQEEVNDTV